MESGDSVLKDKKLTEKEKEIIIGNTVTSYKMEGMDLTEENIKLGRKFLSDEISLDEALAEIFVKGV